MCEPKRTAEYENIWLLFESSVDLLQGSREPHANDLDIPPRVPAHLAQSIGNRFIQVTFGGYDPDAAYAVSPRARGGAVHERDRSCHQPGNDFPPPHLSG